MLGDPNIKRLHKTGHFAVHITPDPAQSFFEKIEDRRIINNLREDGGTTDRREGYQFYVTLSATVLPPAEYPLEQRLYDFSGMTFVGVDMEKSVIKGFNVTDAQSTYHARNKKGRPTYRTTLYFEDILSLPLDKRLSAVDRLNIITAKNASQPRGNEDDLFGVEPPTYIRPMNEALLKITNDSILCLGAKASSVQEHPDVLLDLIYMQHQISENSGVTYPIFIYHDRLKPVLLNTLEASPRLMEANKFYEINVEKVLKQLVEKYPDKIQTSLLNTFNSNPFKKYPMKDYLDRIGYQLDEKNELQRKSGLDSQEKFKSRVKDSLMTVDKIINELNGKFIPFSPEDHVIQIHHPERPENEQYTEINQKNLAQFVKNKVMRLGDSTLTEDQDKIFQYFMKAYNVHFRLTIYKELLSLGASINFPNLERDLKWASTLLSEIQYKSNEAHQLTPYFQMTQNERKMQHSQNPDNNPQPNNKKTFK